MNITRRVLPVIALVFAGTACSASADQRPSLEAGSVEAGSISKECARAFKAAGDVSRYQDTHEDLFPAYSACTSVDEWKAAAETYPEAIEGVDAVRYAMTVCAGNQAELAGTPICAAVNRPDAATIETVKASGGTGLLGVPLPEGATLEKRTPGDPASGRDPSERYLISADAGQIAAFFDRHMAGEGWAKDGTSTDGASFYQKGGLMIGVLMNAQGGSFTLMGS